MTDTSEILREIRVDIRAMRDDIAKMSDDIFAAQVRLAMQRRGTRTEQVLEERVDANV